MSVEHEICRDWQSLYCAGSPMPKVFRQKASEYFNKIFTCDRPELQGFKYNKSDIFRVIKTPYKGKLLDFDDLYYSFSSEINGVEQFATKDKNVRFDLFLIIATPLEAIDFNMLGNDLFEGFNESKFYEEKEVVSKLSFQTIKEIYYLKNATDIERYPQKGILIKKKDLNFSIKRLVTKYNLPIDYLN